MNLKIPSFEEYCDNPNPSIWLQEAFEVRLRVDPTTRRYYLDTNTRSYCFLDSTDICVSYHDYKIDYGETYITLTNYDYTL